MAPFTEGSFAHIPQDVREIFSIVAFDVAWLNAKWKIYRQLFVSGDEVLAILNASAPSFFRIVQDALKADIFLSISRLLDRPSIRGRENASFARLIDHLSSAGYRQAEATLRPIYTEMGSECEQILTRRNRILAHRDLPSALRVDLEALRVVDTDTIARAISLANKLLNEAEAFLAESQTGFDAVTLHDDANHLVAILRRAESR